MNYNVKVEFSTENDKGQIKKQKVQMLVLSEETCSSAENKVKTKLIAEGEDSKMFEVVSVTESKIARII